MDFFRQILEAMQRRAQQPQAQQPQPPQPAPELVVVGRLTDEEILARRQIDILQQQHADQMQRTKLLIMEKNLRTETLITNLRQRLGISFASMTEVTEDYLVRIPRDEAAKHGVISD